MVKKNTKLLSSLASLLFLAVLLIGNFTIGDVADSENKSGNQIVVSEIDVEDDEFKPY